MKCFSSTLVLLFGVLPALFGVVFGCGRGQWKSTNVPEPNPVGQDRDDEQSIASEIEKVTVSTLASTAQSMPYLTSLRPILLDAKNLAIVHRRLIPVNLSEWTAEEKFKLGEFVPVIGTSGTADRVSYREGAQMSQDYVWALRRVAGKTCRKLVDGSIVSLGGSYSLRAGRTGFALVKEDDWSNKKVSLETIQSLKTKVFGFAPPGSAGTWHAGVQELQKIFNDSVASAPSNKKDERMYANYIFLCVSVLSDPRTFVR